MATIKITSPQAKGHAKITVKGKSKLILVNGHWNRFVHLLGMSPGAKKEEYWFYFLGNDLGKFIRKAWMYFSVNEDYQQKPFYVDGSSLYGGDMNGQDRKDAGYTFANKNLAEIIKGVGNEKIYFISHSEGCAYAAGMAKALIERGYKVGQSVMLSADEGDEFNVEGNYICYQITAGYVRDEDITIRYPKPVYTPNVSHRKGLDNGVVKKIFYIDPVVGDNRISGVNRYGVYVDFDASLSTAHASTIDVGVFDKLTELRMMKVTACTIKGKVKFKTMKQNKIWYKIDDKVVINNRIYK